MRISRIALLFLASTVSAQTPAFNYAACPQSVQPDYGFDGIDCVNCEISGRGQPWIVFHTEPSIHAIRRPGPAVGKLMDGDTLVAIDGLTITTRAAAERYASVKPGDSVQFRVRRGGSPVTATIVAGGKCVPGTTPSTYTWSYDRRLAFTPQSWTWSFTPLKHLTPVQWNAGTARFALRRPDSAAVAGWIGIGMFRVLTTPDELRSNNGSIFSVMPEVAAIAPESPAALAGIELGDTLMAVDGISVLTAAGARRFINAPIGVPLELTLRRNGESRRVTVVPKAPPSSPPANSRRLQR